MTSAFRFTESVWSARVTTAHLTTAQSTFPMYLETLTFCLKPPDFVNGTARDFPYSGGLDDIHIDPSEAPDALTPPPHGLGTSPLAFTTQ